MATPRRSSPAIKRRKRRSKRGLQGAPGAWAVGDKAWLRDGWDDTGSGGGQIWIWGTVRALDRDQVKLQIQSRDSDKCGAPIWFYASSLHREPGPPHEGSYTTLDGRRPARRRSARRGLRGFSW